MRTILWVGYALIAMVIGFVLLGLLFSLPWWGLISGLFTIGMITFWIFTVWDVWRRADLSRGAALVWTVVALIFPVIGPFAYYLTRPSADQIRYRGETIA